MISGKDDSEVACKVCRYCHPCKKLVNKEWIFFYICTALMEDKDFHNMTIVVSGDDRCELFTRKE